MRKLKEIAPEPNPNLTAVSEVCQETEYPEDSSHHDSDIPRTRQVHRVAPPHHDQERKGGSYPWEKEVPQQIARALSHGRPLIGRRAEESSATIHSTA